MSGDVVATIMAREYSRSRLTEPQRDREPRRRRAAHFLQTMAHRLDPQIAAPPRAITH
jgi:hypothetical protein